MSQWYLPRVWPSFTDMQHYYHARYPTDDRHLTYMFSLAYFPSRCAWKACFPILLAQVEIPASGSMHPSRCLMSLSHVIIIMKSEVSTFPIVIIFFRGCVPEIFATSYSVTYYHIHSGRTGNLFSLFLCSLWWVQVVWYVLAFRSHSFVCTLHHLIIIIVQIYLKTLNLSSACQIYFVERVSKIKHILSVIHYTICGAVCFQFAHFLCDDWENIYILILIIKSEVWTITHCLGLGHETMVCGVCLSIFW